ncbi:MAG TPA: hypothetical protein ENI94_04345 [Gammaproteobacteria bacterium]|nr:hypothetical protein [Gammaproteobacteria bacterium]
MNLVREVLGPKSKYDKSLPYTYEARVPIFEGSEEFNTYIANTICGLVEHLDSNEITPNEVQIFEVYQEREAPIDMVLFATADNQWRFRPDLCESFKTHYPGHIEDGQCTFADRDGKCKGP